jgi:hypothetical protein
MRVYLTRTIHNEHLLQPPIVCSFKEEKNGPLSEEGEQKGKTGREKYARVSSSVCDHSLFLARSLSLAHSVLQAQ